MDVATRGRVLLYEAEGKGKGLVLQLVTIYPGEMIDKRPGLMHHTDIANEKGFEMRNEWDAHQALCEAVDRAGEWATWGRAVTRRGAKRAGYSRAWWVAMGGLTLVGLVVIVLTR